MRYLLDGHALAPDEEARHKGACNAALSALAANREADVTLNGDFIRDAANAADRALGYADAMVCEYRSRIEEQRRTRVQPGDGDLPAILALEPWNSYTRLLADVSDLVGARGDDDGQSIRLSAWRESTGKWHIWLEEYDNEETDAWSHTGLGTDWQTALTPERVPVALAQVLGELPAATKWADKEREANAGRVAS